MRGPGIPRGAVNTGLVGNHDVAPTFADMAGADAPGFVDGRSFLDLAKDPSSPWPRTAVLSERETDDKAPNRWDMLRMEGGKVYTRHQNGEKEYYDLKRDPYQLHNALGASDTTYPPPDDATLAYYEGRLDALYGCGADGRVTCRQAENQPLLPDAP